MKTRKIKFLKATKTKLRGNKLVYSICFLDVIRASFLVFLKIYFMTYQSNLPNKIVNKFIQGVARFFLSFSSYQQKLMALPSQN